MKSRNLVISGPEKDRLVNACMLTNADFGPGWSSWAEESEMIENRELGVIFVKAFSNNMCLVRVI